MAANAISPPRRLLADGPPWEALSRTITCIRSRTNRTAFRRPGREFSSTDAFAIAIDAGQARLRCPSAAIAPSIAEMPAPEMTASRAPIEVE